MAHPEPSGTGHGQGGGDPTRQPPVLVPAQARTASQAEDPMPAENATIPVRMAPWRIVLALAIAAAADLVSGSIDATMAGVPATIPLDILTALALWAALGRPVVLLVALIAEALPGVGVLPLWTAVVIGIALTGTIPGRLPPRP